MKSHKKYPEDLHSASSKSYQTCRPYGSEKSTKKTIKDGGTGPSMPIINEDDEDENENVTGA